MSERSGPTAAPAQQRRRSVFRSSALARRGSPRPSRWRATYSDEWLVGAEYELFQGISLGVNYTHRHFGRVLEDVGTLPMIAYFLDSDSAARRPVGKRIGRKRDAGCEPLR